MIICPALSVAAANQILLAHLSYLVWPKSHALLIKHALESWMRDVTKKELIASAKRVLLVLANRVYTKRRNTAVSTHNTTQCVVYLFFDILIV